METYMVLPRRCDFGIKYVGRKYAQELIDILKEHYETAVDWEGKLYCGIHINWDYDQKTATLSMPNYIENVIHEFQHKDNKKTVDAPSRYIPFEYGKAGQEIIEELDLPPLAKKI